VSDNNKIFICPADRSAKNTNSHSINPVIASKNIRIKSNETVAIGNKPEPGFLFKRKQGNKKKNAKKDMEFCGNEGKKIIAAKLAFPEEFKLADELVGDDFIIVFPARDSNLVDNFPFREIDQLHSFLSCPEAKVHIIHPEKRLIKTIKLLKYRAVHEQAGT
jgi:hypothetical protein